MKTLEKSGHNDKRNNLAIRMVCVQIENFDEKGRIK